MRLVVGFIINMAFLFLILSSCDSSSQDDSNLIKEYYSGGQLKRVYKLDEKGQKSGQCTTYDEEGNKKEEYYYKSGVRDSIYLAYYPSGNLKQQVYIENGKAEGEAYGYYDKPFHLIDSVVTDSSVYEIYDGTLKVYYYFIDDEVVYECKYSEYGCGLNDTDDYFFPTEEMLKQEGERDYYQLVQGDDHSIWYLTIVPVYFEGKVSRIWTKAGENIQHKEPHFFKRASEREPAYINASYGFEKVGIYYVDYHLSLTSCWDWGNVETLKVTIEIVERDKV